jgi:prefoldin subunit 1
MARFVATPISTVEKRLTTESTMVRKDIAELEKKLYYLETTYKNSREHIEKILQTGVRA